MAWDSNENQSVSFWDWILSFIVDVVSTNTFLELDISIVNVFDLWKEFEKVMKPLRQSCFSTHFISIWFMNQNQLKAKEQVAFHLSYKYVGVRGRHFGVPTCTTYLYVMFEIIHEIVPLEIMFKVDGCQIILLFHTSLQASIPSSLRIFVYRDVTSLVPRKVWFGRPAECVLFM